MKLETTTECKSMVKTENEFESKDKNKLGPTKKETDDSERNKFDEIVKDGSGIEIQLLAPDTHVIKEVESKGEVAEEEAVVNSAIPIDRGWAWMVLLGMSVIHFTPEFLMWTLPSLDLGMSIVANWHVSQNQQQNGKQCRS